MKSKEVIEILQISKSTLYRWTKSGKLPYSRIGHNLLFDRYRIEQLITKNEN